MGVDVANFGRYAADEATAKPLTYDDPVRRRVQEAEFSLDGKKLLGGILVGDASDYGSLMMLAKSDTELPAERGIGARLERRRCRRLRHGDARRRPGVSVQRRRQGRHLPCDSGQRLHGRRRRESLHEGGRRLRRLSAASDGSSRAGAGGSGQNRQHRSVRTLPLHPAATVRYRQGQGDQDLRRTHHGDWTRQRMRDLQAGRQLDARESVEREHPTGSTSDAPGHQRPLPGEHAARRRLLRDSARPRRRNHPRQAHRARLGRQEIPSLHEDHRRATDRHVRRAGASIARHLGGAGSRRFRERSRLRQGAADRQELRRDDMVSVRRTGFGQVRHSGRAALSGDPVSAQAQIGGFRVRA